MKIKVSPEKVVVWIERTASGPFLCIARRNGVLRLQIDRLGPTIIGAKYNIIIGGHHGIVGQEPEYYEP